MEERRTYKETYFWMFILCVIVTMISDHYGIELQQVTGYVDGLLKKAFAGAHTLMIWVVPVAIMVKKEIAAWRTSMHARDVEVAKIEKLATLRQGR